MSNELAQLADSLGKMRQELDGKAYIEQYIQTLTHELKSPLTGIRSAAELLHEPMSDDHRAQFLKNIEHEASRIHAVIEQLLNLAKIEQIQALDNVESVNIKDLVDDILQGQSARMELRSVTCENFLPEHFSLEGDRFLLQQAFSNLLDNAIAFTPKSGHISITELDGGVQIRNSGTQIPEFALPRLTDRFFSLARPETQEKSTGLGLNFVKEIALVHQLTLQVGNDAEGVTVKLLPQAHTTSKY
ncbi:MAG: ATP-binding protein [Pseudomonadota bacterium]